MAFVTRAAPLLAMSGLMAIVACGGGDPPADTGPEADTTVPPVEGGTLAVCETTEPLVMPVSGQLSTLKATIVPTQPRMSVANAGFDPSTLEGEAMYVNMGLADFGWGPGQPHTLREDIERRIATQERRSLSWFIHVSDYQLSDDESPLRWAATDSPAYVSSSAKRPQEAYLPHGINATNRTLTKIEQASSAQFDFGIITGDCIDNAQANELRWFMTLMDGGRLESDSGDDDDPVPGPNNDPKDPFDVMPFPAPWLFVPGNHDLEVIGIFTPGPEHLDRALSTDAATGARDYRLPHGDVTQGPVPSDPERRLIDREEIAQVLLSSPMTPGPVGHGYRAGQDFTLGMNTSYDAVPGLLRIVVVDTNDPTGGSVGMITREQMDGFILPQLERAQRDGVLVMLASHHSTVDIDTATGEFGGLMPGALTGPEVEAEVAEYDNLIAWLVGHAHEHRLRAIQPTDGAGGYWEIMTAAMVDWPAQGRLIEIVDNGNNQLSIFATSFDFDAESCMERRFRRLSLLDYQSQWNPHNPAEEGTENVELLVPVPGTAFGAVRDATARPRIESLTTLAD